MKKSESSNDRRFEIWSVTRERTNADVRTSMAVFVRTSSSLVMGVFGCADIRVDAKAMFWKLNGCNSCQRHLADHNTDVGVLGKLGKPCGVGSGYLG
jgi:hypothetical protein